MKNLILSLSCIFLSVCMHAQEGSSTQPSPTRANKKAVHKNPKLYITAGTGLNNNNGVLGIGVDLPVDKQVSIEAGVGISTWGDKISLSGKYYLQRYHQGWAFGGGVTHNTGLRSYTSKMETIYGTQEEVTMQLFQQTNLFAAAYKYWRLGKRRNSVHLELGWSAELSHGDRFQQIDGNTISDNSRAALNLIAPGGPIVAFGFDFGIY